MDAEEDFYDSLEEDDPQESRQKNKPKSKQKDVHLSKIVPLYQGDTAKELVKPPNPHRKRHSNKQSDIRKDESNELRSITQHKLAVLKDIKPTKSYLDMFYAKIGYPERVDTSKNDIGTTARAVVGGDLSERSNLSAVSQTSFVSDTDSFYLGVIKQEEYIVPPLDLKSSLSRSSSFITNSTVSLNSTLNKSSSNIKIIRRIPSNNARSTNSKSELFLRKAVADMQVSSWKKRQEYGKIASEKNKIRLKELKTLKELDVQ